MTDRTERRPGGERGETLLRATGPPVTDGGDQKNMQFHFRLRF